MVKVGCLAMVVVLGFVLPSAVANAGSSRGWYTSLHTGITDSNNSHTLAGTSNDFGVDVEFSKGFNVGSAVGYHLNDSIRVEGEITYRNNEMSNVLHTNGRTSTTGELAQISLMANVLYEMSFFTFLDAGITPYIGGGLGFTGTELDDFVGPNSSISLLSDDDDVTFAGQFIVGMGYEIFDSTQLTFDYRYFFSDDPEFQDLSGKFEIENTSHNFLFGMRFYFW